jgi:plasmid stabilization system protein ParE
VASVAYSPRALADFERIVDHLVAVGTTGAQEAVELIIDAIGVLERHPLIGRPVRGAIRELVISQGRTGYVALYRVRAERVEVLAVRHQREAGYR